MDLMAKGDFSIAVSEHALKRKDEMGIFARSMAVMNSNLTGEVSQAAAGLSGLPRRLKGAVQSFKV